MAGRASSDRVASADTADKLTDNFQNVHDNSERQSPGLPWTSSPSSSTPFVLHRHEVHQRDEHLAQRYYVETNCSFVHDVPCAAHRAFDMLGGASRVGSIDSIDTLIHHIEYIQHQWRDYLQRSRLPNDDSEDETHESMPSLNNDSD